MEGIITKLLYFVSEDIKITLTLLLFVRAFVRVIIFIRTFIRTKVRRYEGTKVKRLKGTGTFVPSKVPSVTFKREVFLFYARKNQAIF